MSTPKPNPDVNKYAARIEKELDKIFALLREVKPSPQVDAKMEDIYSILKKMRGSFERMAG